MTARRPVRRRGAAVLAAAISLLLAAGCASIPSSSRPQVIAESVPASAAPENDEVRYGEIAPRPGEPPDEIVRDYIRAGGSYEREHARARAYLTAAGDGGWNDKLGTVILEDSPYLDVRNGGAIVQMTARQRARVEADGSYQPNTAPFPYTFRLSKINGNWRIDNPPAGVLIEAGTFDVAYRPWEIYFLDSTRTRVVPDVRWLSAARDSLPSLLVAAIERGPSGWLEPAVQSDLEGVTLQNNVEQESDRVKVYLAGLGEGTDTLPDGAFAQLVWTLNQLGVGGVEIYADGRLLQPRDAPQQSLQRLSDWRKFDPNGITVSTPGYFVRDGAVWTTKGAPLAGPVGRGDFGAVAVSMSSDERSMAVVQRVPGGGQALDVGPPRSPRRTVTGATLTPPSWGLAAREVWTVRNGNEILLVSLAGATTRVVVPDLGRIGTVRALRLSRDGARVAIVAGSDQQARLYIGVVVRQNGAVRVAGLRELDVGETPVSDVAWSDALSVVVLVRAREQDSGLYTASVNGVTTSRLVATSGLPGPPTAIAAAPTLPLLAVAAGALWRTPSTDEGWTRVIAKPASAPAYPG